MNNIIDYTTDGVNTTASFEAHDESFGETLLLKIFAKIWDIQSKLLEYITNAISSI